MSARHLETPREVAEAAQELATLMRPGGRDAGLAIVVALIEHTERRVKREESERLAAAGFAQAAGYLAGGASSREDTANG